MTLKKLKAELDRTRKDLLKVGTELFDLKVRINEHKNYVTLESSANSENIYHCGGDPYKLVCGLDANHISFSNPTYYITSEVTGTVYERFTSHKALMKYLVKNKYYTKGL